MNRLYLREVSQLDAEEIEAYRAEFPASGMRVTYDPYRIPGLDRLEAFDSVEDWLSFCAEMAGKITWYQTRRKADGKTVGFLCLRHELKYDDDDEEFASHIGYSIRPGERGKGYGTEQLRLGLQEARALGLEKVRLICRDTNAGSNRVIRANGGVLVDMIHGEESGMNVNRYDIFLSSGGGDMNSVLETIQNRRSYRGKYKPIPVPREDLTAIMEAGLAAPSGCNKQTTSLIAVDDPDTMRKLHAVIQPAVGETAPAMICVLTKRVIAYRDRCFAVQDYAAAIENMLLAITALGYQSCWVEGHITDADRIGDQMAAILGVPDGYELVCFLPVGVAEEEPTAPKKKPFADRAMFNAFQGIIENP
ncbi:MAG: GNAT family N-acetyltransferase [Clostridia bacterium]|nr:GNAT family N-acetyltransferase [Clostridia bacterium]MBR0408328.1 GNAT family N-acetyltransferase [Clostridia bacterium]